MPTVRGRAEVRRFIAQLPGQIERKLLRGAGRAGGAVIAEEARARALAEETREAIEVKVRGNGSRVEARVIVAKGWGRSIGFWLEYGTEPHTISVHFKTKRGELIRRDTDKRSLLIGDRFVGETVHHPGARAHPFLRVSLDLKEAEAIAAAQAYINARVTPRGIVGDDDGGDA